jgi:hypothetical protein
MASTEPESSALSAIESELSTRPPSAEEQPARLTSPQLPSSSVIQRTRTSFVWRHMPGPVNFIYTRGQHVYWRCKYCTKEYRESGGTGYIALHLKTAHDIHDTIKQQKSSAQQLSIATAFQQGEESQCKRRRLNSLPSSLNPATLEQLFVRWISSCSVGFRMAERPEFRDLLFFLNPGINTWLPTEHHTIQAWTMRTYEAEKQHVQLALQSARSKIHFTVDLWTSANSKALLGMIGHYFADSGDLCQSVLALRELDGPHSGENQSQLVMEVIEEYGIACKVGYFMMDNAENNETMIRSLSLCESCPAVAASGG